MDFEYDYNRTMLERARTSGTGSGIWFGSNWLPVAVDSVEFRTAAANTVREAAETMRPLLEGIARIAGSFSGTLYPWSADLFRVLGEADTAHRAHMRAVHREYRRRSNSRRRRR